ncbi:hypothetical protein P9112_000094 [Eukaryota sp. TZLM1-RC]
MTSTQEPSTSRIIVTHSGVFHADESLSIFLLRQIPRFSNATVIRTRDESRMALADVVVDVGGVFDSSTLRFDHHQRPFEETFPGFSTPLSSAGLVYRHFGKQIIKDRCPHLSDHLVELVHVRLYRNFVEAIDGIDNGVSQYDTDVPKRYSISTDLSSRVKNLNPCWNQSVVDVDHLFAKAVHLVGVEFWDALDYIAGCWLPARAIVEKSVNERFSIDSSGRVVYLDIICPWKEHLLEIEEELGLNADNNILFCIYKDQDQYRLGTVPLVRGSFELRRGICQEWRGLRGEELKVKSGISDANFVHGSGFTGGAGSFESVLKMALLSIENK